MGRAPFRIGMDTKLTAKELAQRVEWEGGPLDAVEYGIHAHQIEDRELRALWTKLEIGYRRLWPLVTEIETRLRKAA